MPDVLPTFPQEPAQGIQAQLDLVYLFNPDVANGVIDKCNELLEEIGELSNLSGKIKPYAELIAPVAQYMPTTYGNGLYVANEIISVLPAEFDPSQWTLIATKINPADITQEINTAVGNEATARSSADDSLQRQITAHVQNESNPHNVTKAQIGLGNVDNTSDANKPISTATQGAINNLQSQIDAISAASDVKDVVGTYAELEQYDTSTLGNNDIIKVLQDETQEDATTYYRWSASSEQFTLIGEEGPYYTKAQTDTLLGDKQDTLTAGEGITIENNVISATASGDYVPQYETLPQATAANVGELAQYSGTTIPDVAASATAEQTVGSSLSSLNVNLDTFISAEQPTGAETISFVAEVAAGFTTPVYFGGDETGAYMTIDQAALVAFVSARSEKTDYNYVRVDYYGVDNFRIRVYFVSGGYVQERNQTEAQINSFGVTVYGTPLESATARSYYAGNATWYKDSEVVSISGYGVTFGGNPEDGDEITVTYTPAVAGKEKGYFYLNTPIRSEQSITVAQTVGSGLSDLSVNIDTFVETEQPTQDEQVAFTANVVHDYGSITLYAGVGDWLISVSAEDFVRTFIEGYGSFFDWQYNGYIVYADGLFYFEGQPDPAQGGSWFGFSKEQLEERGFSFSTNNFNQLDYNTYSYVAGTDQVTWEKDSETVDLAEYGISYSGTPATGDTLTVTYTAPVITGYEWKQINVQPGGGDITWTHHWDRPAGSAMGDVSLYPRFAMLPSGHYRWHFKTGRRRGEHTSYQTFTADFTLQASDDGTVTNFSGDLCWVFDGNTSFYDCRWHFSDNLRLYFDQNPTQSGTYIGPIPVYTGYESGPIENMFFCTDIENVDTGQIIPIDSLETQQPWWYSPMNIDTGEPVSVNINSSSTPWQQYSVSQWLGCGCYMFSGESSEVFMRIRYNLDVLDITARNIGDEHDRKWLIRVDRATGDLKNATFLQPEDGQVCCVLLNLPNDATGYFYAQATRVGMNVKYEDVSLSPVDSYTIIGWVPCTTTQVGTTVTADNYGLIEQYKGDTNANYTNGYYYKAVGTEVVIPEAVTAFNTSPDDIVVTVDGPSLVSAVMAQMGYDRSTVINMISYQQWEIYWDADNNTVTSVICSGYGQWWTGVGIAESFSVSTTGSYSGSVTINTSLSYEKSHIEVQNGHWERIDVQPGGGTTVTIRTWGGNE